MNCIRVFLNPFETVFTTPHFFWIPDENGRRQLLSLDSPPQEFFEVMEKYSPNVVKVHTNIEGPRWDCKVHYTVIFDGTVVIDMRESFYSGCYASMMWETNLVYKMVSRDLHRFFRYLFRWCSDGYILKDFNYNMERFSIINYEFEKKIV